jgi:hypothetical protein
VRFKIYWLTGCRGSGRVGRVMLSLSSLTKLYEWRHARLLSLSKESFALAGLILTPFLAALLRQADVFVTRQLGARYVIGAALAFAAGCLFSWRASRLEIAFAVAAAENQPGEDT